MSGSGACLRLIAVRIVGTVPAMSDDVPLKLPRYVFRRANGSFQYKRNVTLRLRDQTIEANMGLYHKDIQKVLDIFYGVYLKANWSIEIFPTWVRSVNQTTDPIVKMH